MKYTMSVQVLKQWRNVVLIMACFWLVACTEPLHLYQPIDVTRAGQTARFDFKISKAGDYQFSLLFENAVEFEEIERRWKLFGGIHEDGVVVPVHLNLVKDGTTFFDDKLDTGGTEAGIVISHKNKNINVTLRNIRILMLPKGSYSVTLTTLKDVPDVQGIESFFDVAYYNPKI